MGDATARQYRDAVGKLYTALEVVGGHQDRATKLSSIRYQLFQESERVLVKAAFGFVHDEDAG